MLNIFQMTYILCILVINKKLKVKSEYEHLSDDHIMLEFCPTLVNLDIFQNLLY